MSGATLRNVALIALFAAVVAFVPQGGETATFVGNVISLLITIVFVLIGARLYEAHRGDLHGLGDRYRGLLYGAVGVAVLAMAARSRLFDTGAGILAWFALMGAASYALYAVWRRHRAYGL